MSVKFSCSPEARDHILHALMRLPKEVVESRNFLFVCIDNSDARRLVMENYDGYEIIVFSEFIVSRGQVDEDHWIKRYFYFAVFHEIAHAHLNHVSPQKITHMENDKQEEVADALAFNWINDFCKDTNLNIFTEDELRESQMKINSLRARYLNI